MSRIKYEELSCPFCDKGRIQVGYVAGAWSVRQRKTASLPGTQAAKKSSDVWLIQSGCPNCGKPQEEVEKELKRKNII